MTIGMYQEVAIMAEFAAVTSTAVENVQTNQVQATKFLRNGQLLIERDGKIYNAQGAQVR